MTEHMKEAKRLSRVLEEIAQTALRGVDNEQIRGHLMDASALLAHIQRGVPEGYVAVPRFLAENHRNLTDIPRYQRILDDCLAAAPDQFRNAAKMMAVQPSCMTCTAPAPAEVPIPEPDVTALWNYTDSSGEGHSLAYTHDQMRTYGAACRAAGEAAGYARGWKEAGRDAERLDWILDRVGVDHRGVFMTVGNAGKPNKVASVEAIDAALRAEVK